MSARKDFQYPLGKLERWQRRLFSDTLRGLGYTHHVVRAQGALFLVGTVDLIDRALALEGIWEGEQLDDLARVSRTQKADYFLDIGANTGVYSVLFALKDLARNFVAFEPDPGNYARLLANLAVNNLTGKVRALPLAVGNEARSVALMEAGAFNRGESWIAHPDKPPEEAPGVATHGVKQIRFDDEFAIAGKTIVVKMDVEGSEFHSLAGMRRTLAENRCYLQVELYSNRFEELKSFFSELGYRYLRTNYIDHYFTNIDGIS